MSPPGGVWQAAGVLLVVAIVASAIAVHQAQAITMYPVSYATESEAVLDVRGDLTEGGSETHAFDVVAQNLSAFRLVLDWDDTVGPEDRFDVTVTAPNGSVWDVAGSRSPLGLDIPVRPVPTDHDVYALDAMTARALVPMVPPDEEASGSWTVAVRLVSAPGDAGMVGEDVDGATDGEQSYTLIVERQVWRAVVDG